MEQDTDIADALVTQLSVRLGLDQGGVERYTANFMGMCDGLTDSQLLDLCRAPNMPTQNWYFGRVGTPTAPIDRIVSFVNKNTTTKAVYVRNTYGELSLQWMTGDEADMIVLAAAYALHGRRQAEAEQQADLEAARLAAEEALKQKRQEQERLAQRRIELQVELIALDVIEERVTSAQVHTHKERVLQYRKWVNVSRTDIIIFSAARYGGNALAEDVKGRAKETGLDIPSGMLRAMMNVDGHTQGGFVKDLLRGEIRENVLLANSSGDGRGELRLRRERDREPVLRAIQGRRRYLQAHPIF